jgi:hypothetical protein
MTTAAPPITHASTMGPTPKSGPSVVRRFGFWAVVVLLVAALAWGVHGWLGSPAAFHPSAPQSWLPKSMDKPTDQILTGTVAHPALSVAGDAIRVDNPTFSALAVVNGPVVPGEGLPYQPQFITSTWTISLSHVRGTVPINIADFDSIDHLQTVYKPTVVPGQPTLPAALHTGQSLSFKIRSVMPVGEGLLRWAPDGDHIVAKWDFQVEND